MKPIQILIACAAALAVVGTSGCSVARDQQTVGSYVDDSVVTTRVKARFAEDRVVSVMAIQVETLRGLVQLSGFAKSAQEREKAEQLATQVAGVVGVRNDIIVR